VNEYATRSHITRRQLLAGAAALAAAAPLSAFKSRITKASISAITDEIGLTQAAAIEFAHQYGMSWIELRNMPESGKEFAKMTEPELKAAAAELANAKLKVSFLNTSMMKFNWPGLVPGAPVKDADQKRWDRRKDDLANALLAANVLGCDKVRVFTGTRVKDPETTYKQIVQLFEEFIPLAEKAKVHLLIENEYPGNAQELKETPFPDGYALVPKDRILNIQFKASNTLDGPNKMDWKAVLEALQKDNYQYKLGLETHGDAAKRMEHAHASMDEMMHIVGRL